MMKNLLALTLLIGLATAGNLTIDANTTINGTLSVSQWGNSTNQMCLNVTQDGTVTAYDCDNPSVGGGENMVGEVLILAGIALIYIAFKGGDKNGTN